MYTGLAIVQSLLRMGMILRSSVPLRSLAMVGIEFTLDGVSEELAVSICLLN